MNEDQFNRLVRRVDRLRWAFFALAAAVMLLSLHAAEVF